MFSFLLEDLHSEFILKIQNVLIKMKLFLVWGSFDMLKVTVVTVTAINVPSYNSFSIVILN